MCSFLAQRITYAYLEAVDLAQFDESLVSS
jgi:hypothetical protein